MKNWIVTTVTLKGNTFVDPCGDFADATSLFESQKRSLNSAYVQMTDAEDGRVVRQWVGELFGVETETDR